MSTNTPPVEIEIKLYITPQIMALLRVDSLIKDHSTGLWQRKELLNRYYDTPERALTKTNSVLRIRKDATEYIQTLKSSGNSVGGLSQRAELDWILDSAELNLDLLNTDAWPDNLQSVDKKQLSVIFTTDFMREFTFVNWSYDNKLALIEIALDSGLIEARVNSKAICELELELKGGQAETLLDFALVLASRYPMVPSISSKAATGYRLDDPVRQIFSLAEKPKTASISKLIAHYLLTAQQLFEQYQWQASDATLEHWLKQLLLLREQLILIDHAVLVQQLTCIIDDWQHAIIQSSILLDVLFCEELTKVRWGVFSLSVSRWLLNNS